MIIIRKDTVWGPGTKILTDDIQVAQGATLTILPGAQIEGRNHKIEAFGNIAAKGSSNSPIFFNETKLELSDSHQVAGRIDLSYVHMNSGKLGDVSYGSFSLKNSVVTNMTNTIYAWHPEGGNTTISNNIFLDSAGISAGVYDNMDLRTIEIDHNIFDRYYTYSGEHRPGYQGFALNVWDSGDILKPVSHHNAYLDKNLIAIDLEYDAKVNSYGDYFNVNQIKQISKYIYDGNDNLSVSSIVDISKASLTVPSSIVSTLFSYVSINIPSEIVISARLFGSSDVDLTGNKLNNKLTGNVGNNTIDGGLGADTMSGGAGNDTYIVDNARDAVVEYGKNGYDSVVASVSYTLTDNVEQLTLSGTKAINGTGNGLANHLVGNNAANILDGKGGIDVMEGGAGNDTYRVDHASDRVFEAIGEGRDTVVTAVSYRLAAGQEIETLQTADVNGKAALKLTGNAFGNKIYGNAGNNIINGEAGIDEMRGGAGNDTYFVDQTKDVVGEADGGGSDTILSSASYVVKGGQEVENLRLLGSDNLNLVGNEFGQSLTGNGGANRLDGGLGNDALTGGKGADTFVFATKLGTGNVDHITDFTGADTIRLDDAIFRALAPGVLKANEFKDIGKAKIDADDHILYDGRNGSLFYDADGSGKGAALKFAVLDNKAAITHADFLIA